MEYFDIYKKRLNRYGEDYQTRIQTERERLFSLYLKKTTYLVGIWAQLNAKNYRFNKSEAETIKQVNELLKLDILDKLNLYKYGLYISSMAAEIKEIDIDKVNLEYNSLKIKDRNDIKITPVEICDVINEKPSAILNDILSDLEEKIIYEKLENDKDKIIEYLKKVYL